MNEQKKVEFSLYPDEIRALGELLEKFPHGSFAIKKKTRELSDTVRFVTLVVRIYGYSGGATWVWRNNSQGWVEYSEDTWDIW